MSNQKQLNSRWVLSKTTSARTGKFCLGLYVPSIPEYAQVQNSAAYKSIQFDFQMKKWRSKTYAHSALPVRDVFSVSSRFV